MRVDDNLKHRSISFESLCPDFDFFLLRPSFRARTSERIIKSIPDTFEASLQMDYQAVKSDLIATIQDFSTASKIEFENAQQISKERKHTSNSK